MKKLFPLFLVFCFYAMVIFNVEPAYALKAVSTTTGGGGGGSVSVTSGTPDVVINPTPGTGTFTVGTQSLLVQLGTTTPYPVVATDMGKTDTHSNGSSAVAVTLPQSTTTGFGVGAAYTDLNLGTGKETIMPTISTINGNSSIGLWHNGWNFITSDGTNYYAIGYPGVGTVTTNTITKWIDSSGAPTNSSMTDDGTTIHLGATATVTESSGNATFAALTVSSCSGCGSTSNLTLGTSSSVTNPQRTGDVTTGLFSAAINTVSVAIGSSDIADFVAAGESVTGNVKATGPIVCGVQTVAVSGAAIATNYSSGCKVYATMANSATTTINAPSNPIDGGKLLYALTQGTSSTVTWNAVFDFGASGAPTLSVTATKVDYIGFSYDANLTKWVYLGSQLGN